VLRTRVGYTGGERQDPTYHALGDHSEAIQIDYDPERIGYDDLLEIFWRSHDPGRPALSRQYASFIFFHDAEQQRAARASLQRYQERTGRRLHTRIRPAATFYRAEDYHQKFSLRRHPALLRALQAYYPNADDLTDSTAAARLNGYLAGQGSAATLAAEIDDYGLPPALREKLRAIAPRLAR